MHSLPQAVLLFQLILPITWQLNEHLLNETNFLPPKLPTPKKFHDDSNNLSHRNLRKNTLGGCYCIERKDMFTICFGKVSCVKFPSDIKSNTSLFKMKNSHISSIKKNDFANLLQLTHLEIEGNFALNKIEEGSFQDMKNLRNLSISYNSNLKILEEGIFNGLVNLEMLYLVKNGFTTIYHVSESLKASFLPNVKLISLSENQFAEIPENSFEHLDGSSLEELNLVLCQIDYVDPNALKYLKNLTALRLGMNTFNETSIITNLISSSVNTWNIPLKNLNLYDVGLRRKPLKDLLSVVAASNVTSIVLAKNQLENIGKETFPAMPNLQLLDLRETLCVSIEDGAFSTLPELNTLLLSGNKLPNIPPGVLSLEKLTYLDLADNSGDSYTRSYFHIETGQFENTQQLKYLDLSFNRIMTVSKGSFTGLKNLRAIGLKNATIFKIDKGTFSGLDNLLVLNLENNPLGKTMKRSSIDFLQGLESLEVLLLGGCGIANISSFSNPFSHLKNLRHLGLERNKIVKLNADVFASLTRLKTLDVSGNELVPWNKRIFGSNNELHKLAMSNNKLARISKTMLNDFSNLTALDLSGNPFSCDCNFYEVKTWILQEEYNLLKLLERNPSYCLFPESWNGRNVAEFLNSTVTGDICYANVSRNVLIAILAILAGVLVTISVLAYAYRWHLRYFLFLVHLSLIRKGLRFRKRKKPDPETAATYKYDAFVSYSNEDRNFVIRLVAMLENYEPFLKLCVYERDFEIGSVISKAVFDSVTVSRRTLLIISDSFAKSQWCRWETQIAEHHRIYESKGDADCADNLVMVRLGAVTKEHLTPVLKYLMKTRIYLQWDSDPKKQKVFWEKLRNALAPDGDKVGKREEINEIVVSND